MKAIYFLMYCIVLEAIIVCRVCRVGAGLVRCCPTRPQDMTGPRTRDQPGRPGPYTRHLQLQVSSPLSVGTCSCSCRCHRRRPWAPAAAGVIAVVRSCCGSLSLRVDGRQPWWLVVVVLVGRCCCCRVLVRSEERRV